MPDIVSEGFPRWHSLVCMCVCLLFPGTLFWPWVSRYSSFLGVVTTVIVARLLPRIMLSFWICDLWPLYVYILYIYTLARIGVACFNVYIAANTRMEEHPFKKNKHGMHSIWIGLNLDLFHLCMWWKIWVPRLQKPSEQIWISKLWSAHLICLGRG